MILDQSRSMTEQEARLLPPLKLAYIGDAVWELMVATQMVYRGYSVRHIHKEAVARVNARAQSQTLGRMLPALTEAEEDIVRRGRNAHAHHAAPKNQDQADYSAATALEALMGYLYLTGQNERLQQLFALSQTEEETCLRQS